MCDAFDGCGIVGIVDGRQVIHIGMVSGRYCTISFVMVPYDTPYGSTKKIEYVRVYAKSTILNQMNLKIKSILQISVIKVT